MGKKDNRAAEPGYYAEPALKGKGPTTFQNTFSTLSFISVGDKYGKRIPPHSRMVGKQIQTTYPKEGKTQDAYFAGGFRVLLGKYQDTQPQRYMMTQPRDKRKLGFGSSDAHKRDEGMNCCMATILTETFKKENTIQKEAKKSLEERYGTMSDFPNGTGATMQSPEPFSPQGKSRFGSKLRSPQRSKSRSNRWAEFTSTLEMEDYEDGKNYMEGTTGPEFLFDVGRNADTSFCCRSKKDRWFEPKLHATATTWSRGDRVVQGVEKRLGSAAVSLSSMDIGVGAREIEKLNKTSHQPVEFDSSPFSRRSVLQQQLNRNSGALLPPFNGNTISCAGPPGSMLNL